MYTWVNRAFWRKMNFAATKSQKMRKLKIAHTDTKTTKLNMVLVSMKSVGTVCVPNYCHYTTTSVTFQ